jgi:O-antigen ligase
MGILEILIIIILLMLPLGELIRLEPVRDVTVHPIDIAITILVLVWIFKQLKNKKNILAIQNIKPVILFALVCFFSLLANSLWLKPVEIAVSSMYLLRWIVYSGVYFSLRDTGEHFKNVTVKRLLIVDGLIIVVLGFIQLLFYPSLLSLIHYQWDRHMYRLFSVFLDPNYTGLFLVLYFLYISTYFLKSLKNRQKQHVFKFGLITALTAIAIYLTYSRSALLMFLTSASAFLVLINRKKLIWLILGATLIFILISSPRFYIENINLFRVHSSKERVSSAIDALRIIEKNPILGVGFNAYRYAQLKYDFRKPTQNFTSHADAGTDNSFLFIAATTGIIGLASYLFIWYIFIKKAFRNNKRKFNLHSVTVISSIIGLLIGAQFVNSLFYWPIMLWMWIILALMDEK